MQQQQPLVAAAPPPDQPLLNSERIEARFGNVGIEVLSHEGGLRISSLYSLHNGERVTRTFATVRFLAGDALLPPLVPAHRRILAGSSIGSTLTAAGWRVSKQHAWFGEVEITPRLAALMDLSTHATNTISPAPPATSNTPSHLAPPATSNTPGHLAPAATSKTPGQLAVHAYELVAERDGIAQPYALIAEIHHPAYLDLQAVQTVYLGEPGPAVPPPPAVQRLLADLREAAHAGRP